MKAGKASRTAQLVALVRAMETLRASGSRAFEDPYAAHFLGRRYGAVASLARHPVGMKAIDRILDRIAPGGVSSMAGRTAFIDESLRAALGSGISRVVILGAGFDCRAHRIESLGKGAEVFEVDHPDTQVRKRSLIAAALGEKGDRVRYVPVDFTRQTLDETLGPLLAPSAPTFVVWEGVTNYLPMAAIEATLGFIAGATPPGSRLAFTYLDEVYFDPAGRAPGRRLHRWYLSRVGEPNKSGFDPGGLGAFLKPRGFDLLEDRGCGDHQRLVFDPLGRRHSTSPIYHAALAERV